MCVLKILGQLDHIRKFFVHSLIELSYMGELAEWCSESHDFQITVPSLLGSDEKRDEELVPILTKRLISVENNLITNNCMPPYIYLYDQFITVLGCFFRLI